MRATEPSRKRPTRRAKAPSTPSCRGQLIVFEGPDGVGKSTLAKMVTQSPTQSGSALPPDVVSGPRGRHPRTARLPAASRCGCSRRSHDLGNGAPGPSCRRAPRCHGADHPARARVRRARDPGPLLVVDAGLRQGRRYRGQHAESPDRAGGAALGRPAHDTIPCRPGHAHRAQRGCRVLAGTPALVRRARE